MAAAKTPTTVDRWGGGGGGVGEGVGGWLVVKEDDADGGKMNSGMDI